MIKTDQPLHVILDASPDYGSLIGGTATLELQSPTGLITVVSTGVTLNDVTNIVEGTIAEDVLNETGQWRIVAVVTLGENVYVGTAVKLTVEPRFA